MFVDIYNSCSVTFPALTYISSSPAEASREFPPVVYRLKYCVKLDVGYPQNDCLCIVVCGLYYLFDCMFQWSASPQSTTQMETSSLIDHSREKHFKKNSILVWHTGVKMEYACKNPGRWNLNLHHHHYHLCKSADVALTWPTMEWSDRYQTMTVKDLFSDFLT